MFVLSRVVIRVSHSDWISRVRDVTFDQSDVAAQQQRIAEMGATFALPNNLVGRVIDCVPWSKGQVTEDTAVIVLPDDAMLASESSAIVSFQTGDVSETHSCLVVPTARFQLRSAQCRKQQEMDAVYQPCEVLVREDAFLTLGIPENTLVTLAEHVYFIVRRHSIASGATQCESVTFQCSLELLESVFNFAEAKLPGAVKHDEGVVVLPLNIVQPVWSAKNGKRSGASSPKVATAISNESLIVVSPSDDSALSNPSLTIRKLILVPVSHDRHLVYALGEHYADVLSEALKAFVLSGRLHGSLLVEDMIIRLPLHNTSSSSSAGDWTATLAAAESCSMVLKHSASRAGSGNMFMNRGIDGVFMQMRVATVVCSDETATWGFVKTKGNGPLSEISLGSSATNGLCRDLDCSDDPPPPIPRSAPLFSCLNYSHLLDSSSAALDIRSTLLMRCRGTRSVAKELRRSYRSRLQLTFAVVHGSQENLTIEQVIAGCSAVGCAPFVLDGRSFDFDWAVARNIIEECRKEPSPHALVIRHAESAVGHVQFSSIEDLATTLSARDDNDCCLCYPFSVILVSETSDAQISTKLSSLSTSAPIRVCVPGDAERKDVIETILTRTSLLSSSNVPVMQLSKFVSFHSIADWTVGLPLADVVAYAEGAVWSFLSDRATVSDNAVPVLGEEFLERYLKDFQKVHGHNLASTKLQPVRWSDVGGLEEAKREILDTVQLPILHPEIFASGAKRRAGILLYGPPGCGKTLLAKAVATEMNINFISVKGPELINQYVGESERNVRNLFQRARENAPCIVFFDELDALVPARGAKGDAGGAMDRIVAQLLVEVDGVSSGSANNATAEASDSDDEEDSHLLPPILQRSKSSSSMRHHTKRMKDIFIIGATNRPDLLDPSLLRPGRFDRLCYLGLPSNKAEQLFAVRALTRKFNLHADVDLAAIVEPLEFVFTGADFFALCSDAMMFAVDEVVEAARAKIQASVARNSGANNNENEADSDEEENGSDVIVMQCHFVRARNALKASVSAEDLQRYDALRRTFAAKK